jgi:hypothetical protein
VLAQVYKAVLRDTGEEVAIKVQRPGVEPVILRDLFIFRSMARFINPVCKVESAFVGRSPISCHHTWRWHCVSLLVVCATPAPVQIHHTHSTLVISGDILLLWMLIGF